MTTLRMWRQAQRRRPLSPHWTTATSLPCLPPPRPATLTQNRNCSCHVRPSSSRPSTTQASRSTSLGGRRKTTWLASSWASSWSSWYATCPGCSSTFTSSPPSSTPWCVRTLGRKPSHSGPRSWSYSVISSLWSTPQLTFWFIAVLAQNSGRSAERFSGNSKVHTQGRRDWNLELSQATFAKKPLKVKQIKEKSGKDG